MYLTIIKDNESIDHRDYGFECLSFRKSSLSPTNKYETVEGRHGLISTGTVWGGRLLTAEFLIQSIDHIDLELTIDEITEIFSTEGEKELSLIDSRQPGKVWYAKVDKEFTPDRINFRTGRFTVDFISAVPFCRSLGNTLEDPIDFDSDKWQAIAGGLDLSEDMNYSFITNKFKVCNGGVYLDPRQLPLVITFKGASENLQIKNLTTGDVFTYKGTTAAGDTIELNGVRHLKNGVSIFADTNHKRISLKSGWNEFEIIGATSTFTITLSFNFWYK